MTDISAVTASKISLQSLLAQQPHRIVERNGVRYTLLGTAHVSQSSVQAVEQAITSGEFDTVAVELDSQRLLALTRPDTVAQMDLVEVIRSGRLALFASSLALAAYQRRLAEQLGIEPGAELKHAVTLARTQGLAVHLIDRDVGLTFRRASQKLGWLGKLKLVAGLGAGLFSSEKVEEADIEKLKRGDLLEASFGEFAQQSPALYEAIISERDCYMAARLREEQQPQQRNVLVVIGAGHLAGLAQHLQNDTQPPSQLRAQLEEVSKKRRIPWLTLIILAIIVVGIGVGFWQGGLNMGVHMMAIWALYTGGLAGLGALLARSHPLSVLTAMVVAPLKPFRLSIPSGAFAALVETRLRKPAYQDFLQLREDTQTLKGWYRNRVTGVILTFLLTNFGSALGLWLTTLNFYHKLTG